MSFSYERKILSVLGKKKQGIGKKDLYKLCNAKNPNKTAFYTAVETLLEQGYVIEKKGKLISSQKLGLHPAKIVKLNKTFGFAVLDEAGERVFIPGKFLKGAIVGDTVLVSLSNSYGESLEGKVERIVAYGKSEFCAVVTVDNNRFCVVPDDMGDYSIPLVAGSVRAKVGEKVIAKIILRGKRHSEHKARIVSKFGSSDNAGACAKAMLKLSGVSTQFPDEVLAQAEKVSAKTITEKDLSYRVDLRNEKIFTIDSADSKDLDDAVCIKKTDTGYELLVSIADVSHYVKFGSDIDVEAYNRGTSIYYADQVIPMLPKQLSNGICSLNPNEDRLTFTAFLTLDKNANLVSYEFKKTAICSKVKGVYSEINKIFDKSAESEILKKYDDLLDEIFLMKEVADLLYKNKQNRGAPEIETNESKIILDENGKVADIKLRERGESERIIEEFMLLANQAAAHLARENELPFVYRVHEDPSIEKIENLKNTLSVLGIPVKELMTEITPMAYANILKKVKGTELFSVVNMQVLRSMAKAKYSTNPIGHFGLVLEDYAHFTSPIRRYPDLTIHRILNDYICGNSEKNIDKKYRKFADSAAQQSTATELNAVSLERSLEDCYRAEYMRSKIGQEFEGVISGVTAKGIFVELPNTVEGFITVEELPDGQYNFLNDIELYESYTGTRYRIGDKLKVICVRADVNSGKIDFKLA